MFEPDQYALLDFGRGRKLERFGPVVLDRPSPAAEGAQPMDTACWQQATASFHRTEADQGAWQSANNLPAEWSIRHQRIRFELKPTEFGHVGVFPEQAENWDWLGQQISPARQTRVLNLFAYTGGSTLAAAAAGGHVTHIDAARNTVGWARRNAALSGLAEAPIRWIAEDALKFVEREIRRGNRYDAVILDPPSYGHGPKRERWQFDTHFETLLEGCATLTGPRPQFVLVTCHSPGMTPARLKETISSVYRRVPAGQWHAGPLVLESVAGRSLDAGLVARWPG